jgi:putative transcriptional regulator
MITNLVKEFRIKRGLTQEDLAAAVKVSRQTIIAIEKGNYVPSLLLAMSLAKQFNISVEQLFAIKS